MILMLCECNAQCMCVCVCVREREREKEREKEWVCDNFVSPKNSGAGPVSQAVWSLPVVEPVLLNSVPVLTGAGG